MGAPQSAPQSGAGPGGSEIGDPQSAAAYASGWELSAPPAGSDAAVTMLRAGRAVAAAGATAPPRSRRRWPVVAAGGVIIAGVAAGVLVRAVQGTSPPGQRLTARPTTSSAPRVPAAVLAADRPAKLAVTDEGAVVKLAWRTRPGADLPLFVQIKPAPAGNSLRPAGTGTTAMTVTGLKPSAGYCFEVGAVISFGDPSVVAWSAPACIRGAVATSQQHG